MLSNMTKFTLLDLLGFNVFSPKAKFLANSGNKSSFQGKWAWTYQLIDSFNYFIPFTLSTCCAVLGCSYSQALLLIETCRRVGGTTLIRVVGWGLVSLGDGCETETKDELLPPRPREAGCISREGTSSKCAGSAVDEGAPVSLRNCF